MKQRVTFYTVKGPYPDLPFARKHEGFVVVRHTRDRDAILEFNTELASAMERAEDVAERAASDYGRGATSVFKATLLIKKGPPLRPEKLEGRG